MPRFVRSELTTRLIRYLQPFDKMTLIDYAELSRAVNATITSDLYAVVAARKALQVEHNQVWVPVKPKVGLRRLTDLDIAERLRAVWMKGGGRKLVRGRKQSTVVNRNELTGDQQTRLSVNTIQVELALQSLSRATENRLTKVATGSSNDLPTFNALEWAISLMPRPNAR